MYAQIVLQRVKLLEEKNKELTMRLQECQERLEQVQVENQQLQERLRSSLNRFPSLDRSYSLPSSRSTRTMPYTDDSE